jgi:hypothetical protein
MPSLIAQPIAFAFALAALLGVSGTAKAQEFNLEDVPSAASLPAAQLKPNTVAFSDHRKDELVDPNAGLIRFADWERSKPQQKQFLSLYPGYDEPMVKSSANGVNKTKRLRLHVYVADARFVVARPAATIDLARYATLPVLERVDPMLKYKVITPADVLPLKDASLAYNRNPERPWCEGTVPTICLQSRYQLEGKLPLGIMLLNKLRDSEKKIADHITFQSELRVLSPADLDDAALRTMTGIDAPIAGALEQNIFYVNQIMQFGRFVAVFQQHPTEPDKTIATAFMALAVETDIFEKKKELERVPILRNLVPAQVLAGNSSFNTGNSISAGLPVYVRNRIKAIAGLLDRDRVAAGAAK